MDPRGVGIRTPGEVEGSHGSHFCPGVWMGLACPPLKGRLQPGAGGPGSVGITLGIVRPWPPSEGLPVGGLAST